MAAHHRFQRLAIAPPVLAIAMMIGACGPIEYVNQVSRKASSEVAAAKSVRADKYAPYWYTLAVEYLHKAREEAASSDFQAANRFGRRSAEAAKKARSLAIERARNPKATPALVPAAEEEIELVDPSSEEAVNDVGDNPLDSAPDAEEVEEEE